VSFGLPEWLARLAATRAPSRVGNLLGQGGVGAGGRCRRAEVEAQHKPVAAFAQFRGTLPPTPRGEKPRSTAPGILGGLAPERAAHCLDQLRNSIEYRRALRQAGQAARLTRLRAVEQIAAKTPLGIFDLKTLGFWDG